MLNVGRIALRDALLEFVKQSEPGRVFFKTFNLKSSKLWFKFVVANGCNYYIWPYFPNLFIFTCCSYLKKIGLVYYIVLTIYWRKIYIWHPQAKTKLMIWLLKINLYYNHCIYHEIVLSGQCIGHLKSYEQTNKH